MPTLQDRIVWITGAGSGIGRAIAIGFAAAGARVALTGRRVDALAQTASEIGQAAIVVPADVTNADQVAEAYETVNKAWGAVDVLVNNAGRNSSKRHLRQLTVAEMSSLLDVNLKTAFLCSMAVLPAMRARKTGTLIHIGSMAATMVFPTAGATYAAAKSGVRLMSAYINAEEGIHGIRSICINPGEVATEILAARPNPPTQAEQALMRNPERVGRSVGMLAAALLSSAGHLALCTAPLPDRSYRKVAMIIADAQKRIDQSQLVDLRFENIIPTVVEWQNMARNRACAHVKANIHVGGIVANWTEQDAQELLLAATHMGFLYDIRADLLDTFGRPTRRRVVGRDLGMNKKPLFLCAAFERLSPAEQDELSVLIASQALPSEHIRELAARLGVPAALESLREHSSRACELIARSRLNDSAKRFFDQMVRRAARPPRSLDQGL